MNYALIDEQLRRINSATKYPSIETYHRLDPSGGFEGEVVAVPFAVDEPLLVTEKVDGTNARIILPPVSAGWYLGSREELLTTAGDVVYNDSEKIVTTLRETADMMTRRNAVEECRHLGIVASSDTWVVVYGEVYGANRGGDRGRAYGGAGVLDYRVFDVALVDSHVLDSSVEDIARWRQHGGQRWLTDVEQARLCAVWGLQQVPLIEMHERLPIGVEDTRLWLERYGSTSSCVIAEDDADPGRCEGLVVRNEDRSRIAKLRHQNYRRDQMLRERARAAMVSR